QAEDGIRDFHVTGVQTCALPISYTMEDPPVGDRRNSSHAFYCAGHIVSAYCHIDASIVGKVELNRVGTTTNRPLLVGYVRGGPKLAKTRMTNTGQPNSLLRLFRVFKCERPECGEYARLTPPPGKDPLPGVGHGFAIRIATSGKAFDIFRLLEALADDVGAHHAARLLGKEADDLVLAVLAVFKYRRNDFCIQLSAIH